MKKLVLTLLILIFTSSLILRLDFVQTPLRRLIEKTLEEQCGEKVSIGTISGVVPFYIRVDTISSDSIDASSLLVVPSIPDLLLGRIAVLHLGAKSIKVNIEKKLSTRGILKENQLLDLLFKGNSRAEKESANDLLKPLLSFMPDAKISVYSIRFPTIDIDSRYFMSLKASLFWNHKKHFLQTHLDVSNIQVGSSENSSYPTHAKVDFQASLQEIKITTDFELADLLPRSQLKKLNGACTFTSRHKKILQLIWGDSQAGRSGTILDCLYKIEAKLDDKTKIIDPERILELQGEASLFAEDGLSFKNSLLRYSILEPLAINDTDGDSPPRITRQSFFKRAVPYQVVGDISGVCHFSEDAINLTVAAEQLQYRNVRLKNLHTQFSIKDFEAGAAGGIKGNCTLDRLLDIHQDEIRFHDVGDLPVTFHASFSNFDRTSIRIDELQFTAEKAQMTGSLQLFFYPLLLKGKVEGKIPELHAFSKLLLQEMRGNGRFSFFFDPTLKRNNDYDLKQHFAHTSQWTDLHIGPLYSKSLHITAKSTGLFPKPTIELRVTSDKAVYNHLDIDSFSLGVSCNIASPILQIPVQMNLAAHTSASPITVGIDAEILASSPWAPQTTDKNLEERFFEVSKLTTTFNQKKAVLNKPFRIDLDSDRFVIHPFSLNRPNAGLDINTSKVEILPVIKGGGALLRDTINMHLEFNDCSVLPLQLAFPQFYVGGLFSGQLDLFGKVSEPKAHIGIVSDSLILQPRAEKSEELPLSALFSADIQDGECKASLQLHGVDADNPLDISLNIPCFFSILPPRFHLLTDSPISGTITGESALSYYRWLFNDDQTLEGNALFDLKIFGTPLHPKWSGQIKIDGGKIDIQPTGCTLSNLNISATARNDTLLLDHFEGTDEEKGSFTGNGTISFNSAQGYPFRLNLLVDKMSLLDKDLIYAAASGKGVLSGDSEQMSLEAQLTLDVGKVNLNAQPAKDLPLINIIYTYNGDAIPQQGAKQKPFHLDLDITMDKHAMAIKGIGLKTHWKGNLAVKGNPESLAFFGKIHITDGIYSLGGKACKITKGDVEWNGPILSHSNMTLHATCPTPDIDATLILKGPLGKPSLSAQSLPPLPQKEILSRILFNKPLADISPVEALQLAQILLSVNAQKGNDNIVQKLKRSLGIDTIDITHSVNDMDPTGNSNAVSVQIGKYLSQGVFVRLSKDVTNEVNRVGVEAQVLKNVSVCGEVGDDASGAVRLRWKKDW